MSDCRTVGLLRSPKSPSILSGSSSKVSWFARRLLQSPEISRGPSKRNHTAQQIRAAAEVLTFRRRHLRVCLPVPRLSRAHFSGRGQQKGGVRKSASASANAHTYPRGLGNFRFDRSSSTGNLTTLYCCTNTTAAAEACFFLHSSAATGAVLETYKEEATAARESEWRTFCEGNPRGFCWEGRLLLASA